MIVEDTSAFIEQLEIVEPDKRVAKRRLRVKRAELEVLRLEWAMRIESNAVEGIQRTLDVLGEPADETDGPDDRGTKGARALEKQLAGARSRLQALRGEMLAKREKLHGLEREVTQVERTGRPSRLVRFHSAEHHVECSEQRFARLAHRQAEHPVLILSKSGRRWWWFRDRFWWGDDRLTSREVARLVQRTAADAKQHATTFRAERSRLLDSANGRHQHVPHTVRFVVWYRDKGRCVRCGSGEDVVYHWVVPLVDGGSDDESNVELRCQRCAGSGSRSGSGRRGRQP